MLRPDENAIPVEGTYWHAQDIFIEVLTDAIKAAEAARTFQRNSEVT